MNKIEEQILNNQLAIMWALKLSNTEAMKDMLHINIIRTQSLIDDKLNENESYGEAPKIELEKRF